MLSVLWTRAIFNIQNKVSTKLMTIHSIEKLAELKGFTI